MPDPYQENYGTPGPTADEYCNICNPFQYDTSIMSHPDQVKAHIQDSVNLYSDIANGTLPAVSIVKPSGYTDGHPASSKLDLFEGFVKKIVDQVQASPVRQGHRHLHHLRRRRRLLRFGLRAAGRFLRRRHAHPADRGVPYVKPGHISHDYADHVSILKFIERNWGLGPITQRSRDNFPNPVTSADNPYVPLNSPALGDLFDLFDFGYSNGQ